MALSELQSIPLNEEGLEAAANYNSKQEEMADPGTDRMKPSKLKVPKSKLKTKKDQKIPKKKRKISTKSDGGYVEIAPHAADHLHANQKPVQVELNNFDQQLFDHDSNDHPHTAKNQIRLGGNSQTELKPQALTATGQKPLKSSIKKAVRPPTTTQPTSQKPISVTAHRQEQESEEAVKAQRDELQ